MEQEVAASASAGNLFAVYGVVDGNFSAMDCPYTGEVPTDGSYTDARARQTFLVTKGTHTVSTYRYLSDTATAYSYDVHYDVYVP